MQGKIMQGTEFAADEIRTSRLLIYQCLSSVPINFRGDWKVLFG